MHEAGKDRFLVIFCFFVSLYSIVIINLAYLQIYNHSYLCIRGNHQYHGLLKISSPRAPIVDRHGCYLAMNRDAMSAFITPHALQQKEALYQFLAQHFPHALNQLKEKSDASFMFIKRRLSDEELHYIQQEGNSNIRLLKEPSRFYPLPAALPIIGCTDIDNQGLFGLELYYNNILAGIPSTATIEKDARSKSYFSREEIQKGSISSPLMLTLDSALAYLIFQELMKAHSHWQAEESQAIVLDPASGEIFAMITIPHADPYQPITDIALTKNRIVTESYELGSVMKVFTAIAALEEKVTSLMEPVDCKSSKIARIDGRTVRTWKADTIIPFQEVVATSNNIGIAIIAKRVDTILYDHLQRLGFGKKTGIDFPGEVSGFINPPHAWSKQSIISLSYGYEIRATILQLACAFALIANNGIPCTPHLRLDKKANKAATTPLYSAQTIADICAILRLTTEQGTARRAAMQGYEILAKTGTTNILENGIYRTDKHAFTCAGIIKKGGYQRVLVVFITGVVSCSPLYASHVAVPLFEAIAHKIVIHDRII